MKKVFSYMLITIFSTSVFAQTKVIFDTDIGSDCDDAGAMAVLHKLADKGEVEILGVVYSSGKNKFGIGVCDAINTYYGRGDLPLGQNHKNDVGDPRDFFSKKIAIDTVTYHHDVISSAKDLVSAYKMMLEKEQDASVTIITVGHPIGLVHLLRDDEGVRLVRSKVSRWVAMGGGGWNFSQNGMAEYMHELLEKWPCKLYMSSYGKKVITGNMKLPNTPENNPVRKAYESFIWNCLEKGRPSWDQIAVLFAIRPQYFRIESHGFVEQTEDKNVRWNNRTNNPKHYYVLPKISDTEMRGIIEDLMSEQPGVLNEPDQVNTLMPSAPSADNVSTGMGELLVAKGADISSLHAAAYVGDLGKVKSFIDEGVAINDKKGMAQNTALHTAAAGGHKEIVEFLIASGANIDAKDRRGRTPLDLAVSKRDDEVVNLVVKHDLESTEPPKPWRDVSVANVLVSPVCTRGDNLSITVRLANRGTFRESFAVTLQNQTDDEVLETRTITVGKKWTGKADDVPDMIFNGETQGIDLFGNRVFSSGDTNGDGHFDILVTSAKWGKGLGRAYLYYGGPNMDTETDMLFTGKEKGCALGNQSGFLTDLNKDGYDDLVIGAPGRTWETKHDGCVNIFYGGPRMDNIPDVVLRGQADSEEHLGLMVTAEDVDKDGYIDILAGAQGYANLCGRVYLFWGGDPFDTTPDVIFEGEMEKSLFGRRIDAGGDVNGDGYNDILVGARTYGGDAWNGRAYLFLGHAKDKMNSVCDWTFTGKTRGQTGSSVELFDIDADGYADAIVGSRGVRSVYIFWGTKDFDPTKPNLVLQAPTGAALGGDDVECGYFNNDGFGDILSGAYGYPGTGYMYGRAYIFYGNSKALMDTNHDYIFGGECGVDDYFGCEVSAGDVNGDGHVDALLGAVGANEKTGRAYLHYGPFNDTTDITFTWDTTNASIGTHTLKVEITPVPEEQNTEDNVKTVTIEVKEPSK